MESNGYCRLCLVTDVELRDMGTSKLLEPYESLTGIKISETNQLSNSICSCCKALLLKCIWFVNKCKKAEEVLDIATQRYNVTIETKFLNTVDRVGLKLTLPLQKSDQEFISYPSEVPIKEEIPFEDYFNDNIDFFSSEDPQDFKPEITELNEPENSDLSDEILSDVAKKNSLKKLQTKKKVVKRKRLKKERVTLKERRKVEKDLDDPWSKDVDIPKSEHNPVLLEKWDMSFKIMTKEEAIAELQSRKRSLNYLRCLFKCEKCYKGFQTEATLNNHMVIHDPRMGVLECDICFQRYSNKVRLRYHVKKTHLYRYICRQCGISSKTVCRAKLHHKWHLGFTYNCKICGASFKKTTTYFTHLRQTHPTCKFRCGLCNVSFISERGLQHHNKIRHSLMAPTHCELCNFKFTNENALQAHQQESENGVCDPNVKPCPHCGVSFYTEEDLKQHGKERHPKMRCFKCPICHKLLSSHKTLGQHYESIHLGIKRGVHEPGGGAAGGALVCEVCGKICSNKHVYADHQRQHTGEKPFQCSQCPKKFVRMCNLQVHARTHTGERPYKCDQCEKSFRSKACVNRHSRVHTGAKPFACPHCGKTFTQTNSVKLHINTVHFKMPQPYRNRRKQT